MPSSDDTRWKQRKRQMLEDVKAEYTCFCCGSSRPKPARYYAETVNGTLLKPDERRFDEEVPGWNMQDVGRCCVKRLRREGYFVGAI